MEYRHGRGPGLFSSIIYVFSDNTVDVCLEVGSGENICIRKKDGELITSATGTSQLFNNLRGVGAPKGAILARSENDENALTVVFGPGDRMPVLNSAPYRTQGASVWIDWSQNHSEYFAVSGCGSGSEVFTVKNDGLVLESSTAPGFTLTMGDRALSKFEQEMKDEIKRLERRRSEIGEDLRRQREAMGEARKEISQ